MWIDGKLHDKADGGQLHPHGDDTGIGFVNQNTVYHDDAGGGSNIDWFDGSIDEVIVYGSAFNNNDFANLAGALSVEPEDKLTTMWSRIKRHTF